MTQSVNSRLTGWAAVASAKGVALETAGTGGKNCNHHNHRRNHQGNYHNNHSYHNHHHHHHHNQQQQQQQQGSEEVNNLGVPSTSNSLSGSTQSKESLVNRNNSNKNGTGSKNYNLGEVVVASETKDLKKTRKLQRPSFNAQEVEIFLQENFRYYAKTAVPYVSNSRSDSWDTNTSNRWKSRRYGCLNEITRVLRS